MTTATAIQEKINAMREEGEGDRDGYYESYGSGIQSTLVPLAALLEASAAQHPELVELVLLNISQTGSSERIDELNAALAAKAVADPKKLWKFYWYMGRQGEVESVFTATQSEIDEILDKNIYFGEILGKHSEVYGVIEAKDLEVLSEDASLIAVFEKHVGSTGHNPLDYLEEE